MNKETRKLTKTKRSLYLVIPSDFIRKYGWQEHQKLIVEDLGRGRILIRDWRK